MSIKQISIFLENKPGRLAKITEILAQNKVDIRALSIADTTDYGILRLIVNDPDDAEKVLKSAGLTVSITEVLGIAIPDEPGSFANTMKILAESEIGVEYAYAFITPNVGTAYVIIRVDDNAKTVEVLTKSGIKILGQSDIFS